MNSAFVQICDLVDRGGAELILVGITLHLQDTDPASLSDYTGFSAKQLSDTGAQIVEIAVLRDDITAPVIRLQSHHSGSNVGESGNQAAVGNTGGIQQFRTEAAADDTLFIGNLCELKTAVAGESFQTAVD